MAFATRYIDSFIKKLSKIVKSSVPKDKIQFIFKEIETNPGIVNQLKGFPNVHSFHFTHNKTEFRILFKFDRCPQDECKFIEFEHPSNPSINECKV